MPHRFKDDPEFGEILRRLRNGTVSKDAIKQMHARFANNKIQLPLITNIRWACYKNEERNAYNNVVFQKDLTTTHPKSNYLFTACQAHIYIIKAFVRYKRKSIGRHLTMYIRNLDEYGDSDTISSMETFLDSALKFLHSILLMVHTNERSGE